MITPIIIPTTCINPDCTSRLHFIGGGYAYQEWIEAMVLEKEKTKKRRLKAQLKKNKEEE